MPSSSSLISAPVTSTMVSTAPSSWKWTSSTRLPWIPASASAICVKICVARALMCAGRSLASMMAVTSLRWRCAIVSPV
jgi:hypothetical protein